MTTVRSYGPHTASYAAVGQSPGRKEGEEGRPFVGPAGELARAWVKDTTGLNPDDLYWCNVTEEVLLGDERPTATEVKHGIERVKQELAELPHLKAVILFGSFAAKAAFSLKGGITRVHGQTGKLELPATTTRAAREVDCVACLHPSYVNRQRNLRQKQLLDNDCRAVVSRLTYVSQPLVLPDIEVQSPSENIIKGVFGLDTETARQVGKRVDPRRDPLLITALSDGSVYVGAPQIGPDAEPIVHNIPFDSVVMGMWEPKWHDSKMLAHLLGMYDTTLKGAASRILGRPMMEYDPNLRERAAAKILAGVGPEDDEDVKVFMGYCAQDALAHHDLFQALWKRADDGAKMVYNLIERPFLRLYSRWTMEGVWRLDRKAALKKRDAIDIRVREMRRKLKAETGIESPHQHAKIRETLGIPSTEAKWVEKNWGSFNKRQQRVLRLVGELRTIERQVSTYIDAWLEWPDELLSTNWRPTAAWTGRPGSANLNLQNIPVACGECPLCLKGKTRDCAFNLQPLLLPPRGMALYELDNSQADLRVAAHNSQDPNMLKAFTEGIEIDGERVFDLHRWAQLKVGFPSRREAKTRVLATLFGQTESGMKADPAIQQAFRSLFKVYVQWSNKVKRLSVVPGLFGRSLYVPPHPSDAHREREAIAAPSQGGSADVLKLQDIALEDEGFNTRHQIHDSVFVAMPESDAGEEVEHEMTRIMEEAVELTVPLKVDCKRWNP